MSCYMKTSQIESDFGQHTEYYTVREIAKGGYATVYLVRLPKNPIMKVAMKQIDVDTALVPTTIETEYHLHKGLMSNGGHENIIKMFGMKKELYHYVFFMEFADNGTLRDKMKVNGQPPAIVRKYFRQLITGVEYLHKCGVTHCDIKPQNLLLNKFEILKIADFGLSARHLDADGNHIKVPGHIGTRPYAAPEVWNYPELDGPPTDVWSTGIVLVELLAGTRPWDKAAKEMSVAYRQWVEKSTDLMEKPWCMLDYKALNFATSILSDNIEKRLTIQQIKEHEWYRNGYESVEDEKKTKKKVLAPKKDTKTTTSMHPQQSYWSPSTSDMLAEMVAMAVENNEGIPIKFAPIEQARMTRLSKSQKQFTVLRHEEQGHVCRYRVRVNGQETWLIEKYMTKSQREVLEKYRVETYPEVYYSIKDYKIESILDIHHFPTEGEMLLVNFFGYVGPIWHYWVPRKDIKTGVKALRAAYMKKKAKEESDLNAACATSTTLSAVDAAANSTISSTSSFVGSTSKMLGDQIPKEEKKVEQKREVPHETSSGSSSSATSSSQVVGQQTVKQQKKMEKDPRRKNFLESSYGSHAGPSTQSKASTTGTSSSIPRTNVMDVLDDVDLDDTNVPRKPNQTSLSSLPTKPFTIGSPKTEGTVLEHRLMSTAVSRENVALNHSTQGKKVTEEREENKKTEKMEEVNGAEHVTGIISKRVLEKAVENAERALQRKKEQEEALKKWKQDNRKSDNASLRTGSTACATTTTTQKKSREEPRGPPSKMSKTGFGSKLTTVGFASSSLNGRPAPVTFLPTSQAPQQVHRQSPAASLRQAPPQGSSLLLRLLQSPLSVYDHPEGLSLRQNAPAQQQLPAPVPPPLRKPVKPVLELLVENDAAEEIDLPAQGVDYIKWTTDETLSCVLAAFQGTVRLCNIRSRVIKGKMTGVIIEEFINDPKTITTKLNLTASQLLRAKALAPFTINKQRRAVYRGALAKYNIELAQWRSTHPEEQE